MGATHVDTPSSIPPTTASYACLPRNATRSIYILPLFYGSHSSLIGQCTSTSTSTKDETSMLVRATVLYRYTYTSDTNALVFLWRGKEKGATSTSAVLLHHCSSNTSTSAGIISFRVYSLAKETRLLVYHHTICIPTSSYSCCLMKVRRTSYTPPYLGALATNHTSTSTRAEIECTGMQ